MQIRVDIIEPSQEFFVFHAERKIIKNVIGESGLGS